MSRTPRYTVVFAALTLSLAAAAFAGSPAPTSHPASAKATPLAHVSHAKTSSHASMKLDLNTATREDLMKLPGIGEALADKIIAARPFTSKSELVSKSIVTKAEFAKISGKVVAKQSAAMPGSSK